MSKPATYRVQDNNYMIVYRGSRKDCLQVLRQMVPNAAGCVLQHWTEGHWVTERT